MRDLARAYKDAGEIGEALPTVFQGFGLYDVSIRRGTTTLIGAAPGGAKSVLANNLAVLSKVPTLFFSADTNEVEVAERICAMVMQQPIALCREQLLKGDSAAVTALKSVSHIEWDFTDAPTYSHIVEHCEAFFVKWGVMPDLIVIDNLANVNNGIKDEVPHDVDAVFFGKTLARHTKAAVIMLHHLTGEHEDGSTIPGQGAFKGKIAKYVNLALTLWRGQQGDVMCSIVKNRGGEADSTGRRLKFAFQTDLSKASLR